MSKTSRGEVNKRKANYGWVLVGVLLFGAIVNYLDRVNLSIGNTTIAKQFHLNPLQMGILLSAFLWPYALSNLPSGWLVDKFGPKKLFTAATILWSVATLLGGLSNGFTTLYMSRILLGIAEAPFFICGAKIAQMWFTDEERGLAIGTYNMGPQIANVIAPPLLTAILISFGWRYMFIGLGLLGFLVTFVWLKLYKDKEKEYPEDSNIEILDKKEKISWSILFKHRSTWAMMAGDFGIMYVFWVYLTWLPAYLSTQRGFSLIKTGWVAAIPYLAGSIGVPLGGFLSDYLIREKGFKPINARKTIIVAAAILAAAVVAPVPFVKSTTISILLLSIGFFASSMPTGVIWTLASDVAPSELVGSLGAIQNFSGYIGATMAPIVTGAIISKTHSFNYVFLVASVVCIFGAVSYALFLKEPIKQ